MIKIRMEEFTNGQNFNLVISNGKQFISSKFGFA